MWIILSILVSLCILCIAYGIYLEVRNTKVAIFRQTILDYISIYNEAFHKDVHKILMDTVMDDDFNIDKFREDCSKHESQINEMFTIYNRISYDRMVLSFKPLKLENWYTTEEIEIITKEYKR